jgi:hypothetical protein
MTDTTYSAPPRLLTPTRNRYYYGKLLDAFHFELEQRYFNRHRWLLNRASLGTGVLCGLGVAKTADGTQLRVAAGVAIDGWGREVVVPAESPPVDPRQPTDHHGRADGDRLEGAAVVTLYLCYHECDADPEPVLLDECGDRHTCAPSTVRERYRLLVREGVPDPVPPTLDAAQCAALFGEQREEAPPIGTHAPIDTHAHDAPGATGAALRRRLICDLIGHVCPEPPEDPCIPLAVLALEDDGSVGAMDVCARRPKVYSNAVLLDLILCLAERVDECCREGGPVSPVDVRSIRYVSGDNQSAGVSTPVEEPLVVEVLKNGAPSAGEPVTFREAGGGGAVGADAQSAADHYETTTGTDGRASAVWVLGPNPRVNVVDAVLTAPGVTGQRVTFHARASARETRPPVVRAIWPPNGSRLDDDGLRAWDRAPRLELTFDRELDPAHIAAPGDWLRLWGRGQPLTHVPPLTRIQLGAGAIVDPSVLGVEGVTYAFRLPDTPADGPSRWRNALYLVQLRADRGVPADADGELLDADFAGTRLTREELDRIWKATSIALSSDMVGRFAPSGATLPQSGDGTPGGTFHAAFSVPANP